MRKILIAIALLGVSACSSTSSSKAPPGAVIGSTAAGGINAAGGTGSPRAAVDGFLAAVKRQDLQGMSMLWGTEKGLARDQMSRDELEKRLVIMQCSLNHDSWKIVSGLDGTTRVNEQDFRVELQQKNLKEQTMVTAVKGVSGRWYVKNAEITKLSSFCR
ncbi:MAG: hypothetical protein ABI120_11815 [Gemmatimonadaceae bacterium]